MCVCVRERVCVCVCVCIRAPVCARAPVCVRALVCAHSVDDLESIDDLEKYIAQSTVAMLFLSRGYFMSRNWCVLEWEWSLGARSMGGAPDRRVSVGWGRVGLNSDAPAPVWL